jgi:hypothetical protein
MTWVLILLAVNINNPSDVPGKVYLYFETEQQCIKAKENMKYWLKFDSFKVTSECKKSSS